MKKVIVFVMSLMALSIAYGADGTWSNAGVDNNFHNVSNWVDQIRASGVATFPELGSDQTVYGTANMVFGSAYFTNITHNYSFSGKRVEVGGVTITSNSTGNVSFGTNRRNKTGATVRNYGSGTCYIGRIQVDNSTTTIRYAKFYTVGTITLNDLTVSGTLVKLQKYQDGTLVCNGYQSRIVGSNIGNFTIDEGTFDTSSMTLKFENTASMTEDQYVVIDYAGGTLLPASSSQVFADVLGLPEGFEIYHDASNKMVYLQEKAAGTVVIVR